LRVLAKLRRLRGTKLDPFGWSADRRLERELLSRYEALLDRVVAELDDSRFDLALALTRLPEQVRGYGPIKRAAATRAQAVEQELWQQWTTPAARGERARVAPREPARAVAR
jgi:indolepyruvate ferredoxin oxidoreductase